MTDIEKLREQNDAFRQTLIGGAVRFSGALRYYSPIDQNRIMQRIKTFAEWKTDNGHKSEHDFGAFKYDEEQYVFWAIHYQDTNDLGKPSPDPADPTKTFRLLMVTLIEWWDDGGEEEDDDDGGAYKPELEPPR